MSNQVIKYNANGQEVSLSVNAVSQFITKGNGEISDQEAYNFIQLCRYAELNPFLNEAYLIKFGNQPAQMVVGKEAFMKRANRNEDYNGFEAGVVVLRNKEIMHKKGQAVYPGEKLLGGWARVHKKSVDFPVEVEVTMEEFGKNQATWKQQPANMIRKVALVNALREAFPEDLGALYTEDEPAPQENRDVTEEPASEKAKSLIDDFKKTQPKEDDEPVEVEAELVDEEDESEEAENVELFEGSTTKPKSE